MGSARWVRTTGASLGLVLVLVLPGCGVPGKMGLSNDRPQIGYVLSNMTAHFAQEMGAGFHAGAQTAGGVDAVVTGPRVPNGPEQIDQFKQLTTTAKGGIAISATGRTQLILPMAEASASGIPLLVSADPPVPGSGVKLLVENDNYELGRMLADEAIKRLPPDAAGKVVLGNDVATHPVLHKRAAGIRDKLASERPKLQVVGPFDTHREKDANQEAWRSLVATNPDAVAFVGTGDLDTLTLAENGPGTGGNRLVGGFSGEAQALQGVKDGHLFAVISPEHFLKGACTGWLLAEAAKGSRPLPEGWLATPGLAVTSDNVDEIFHRQSSDQVRAAWVQPQIDQIMSNPSQYIRPLDQAE